MKLTKNFENEPGLLLLAFMGPVKAQLILLI